jgi:glycine betaine/proline transport system ATP-binding protein
MPPLPMSLDDDGKPIGALDIQEVISAMVTPVDHETAA